MFDRLFQDHPRNIGMSWGEHGSGAARLGLLMIGGGVLCLVHALVPGLFVRTTSNLLENLNDTARRRKALDHPDYEI
ncbi:DUF6356 family protein [Sphingomicrobium nitratireducens]|uniref:DUF6356 family protein n=1 Tax=Sphingomicrobium nitratireducens TaxID=2964666 RepID=UPI002240E264|nr:DUF6356 family protein [Sphingomicrobium nitratireducens]